MSTRSKMPAIRISVPYTLSKPPAIGSPASRRKGEHLPLSNF
jgi:hypothetical protein